MSKYKKTRAMNLVAGWGFALSGIALFFNKVGEQPVIALAAIALIFGVCMGTALGTAHALSREQYSKIHTVCIWLNWLFVGFYAIGVAATVLGTFASPDVMGRMLARLAPSVLFFVIPQLINLRALYSVRALSQLPKAESTEVQFPN